MEGGSENKTIQGKRGLLKQSSEDDNDEEVISPLTTEERNCINAKMHLLTHYTEDGTSL